MKHAGAVDVRVVISRDEAACADAWKVLVPGVHGKVCAQIAMRSLECRVGGHLSYGELSCAQSQAMV